MFPVTNILEKIKSSVKPENENLIGRERWLKKTLKKIKKGSKILDAGAGELRYKKYCTHLKYTSQDFSKYDNNKEKEGLHISDWNSSGVDIVSDITKIPVNNKSFDAVMCIEVLEHLPKPEEAIKEFSRILKKSGQLIITAPFCSLTHFAPYYFSNGYSQYWYKEILKKYDFEIIELRKNGNYFDYLHQEISRLYYMNDNYLKKNSLFLFDKIAILLIKYLLKRMSQNNKKSEELLCFGIHVLAQKK